MMGRYVAAIGVATIVTFGLFYLMQALITQGAGDLGEGVAAQMVNFVRLQRERDLELKKRRRPEKKPPKEEPPPMNLKVAVSQKPVQNMPSVALPAFNAAFDTGVGPSMQMGASDSDIIPLVRVNPEYPLRAVDRELEGWVVVEFTISAAGKVVDPRVIDSKPSSIFNRSALRAIRKWKYNPRIEDGVAVEQTGIRVQLDFNLNDG